MNSFPWPTKSTYCIVIDSDRSSAVDPINSTKARIVGELDQGPGFAWVTQGREIENYVASEVMERAVKTVCPKAKTLASSDSYEHIWHYKTDSGEVRDDTDKVKIAREVSSAEPNLAVLDLKSQVEKLVQFIQKSNGQ